MKTIILVVMLFTYDGEGKVADKDRHEFVQDSMAACVVAQRETMRDYYQQPELSIKTEGILTLCRTKATKEVSPDGQSTEGSKLPL